MNHEEVPARSHGKMTGRSGFLLAEGLGLLHETGRVIHIAGGEAMLYWDVLSEALRLAHERNIQTNCGMILGRLPETTPAAVLARGPERANRFVTVVCEQGPRGLAELARREYGFVPPQRLTQTCELCYLARAFLRQFHPDVFGPVEVYG